MIKNYKVNVEFIINVNQDKETSKLALNGSGTLIKYKDHQKLIFKTQANGQNYEFETTIKNDNIKIQQLSPNLSLLEFEAGVKTFANYQTPYGALNLELKTSKLVINQEQVEIAYFVNSDDNTIVSNSILIKIKELM